MWTHVMVVSSILTQIYNERRLFFGGGPGVVPSDNFASVSPSNQNAERRSSRGRGMLMLASATFVALILTCL